jgi:glyoxalase family protein
MEFDPQAAWIGLHAEDGIMLDQIRGLHHVTSLAHDAVVNNRFFTRTLGLRRIKKTVNFDKPDIYHLYYGDETGTPGKVMTYFPDPARKRCRHGAGEGGFTRFSIPRGSIEFWRRRLLEANVALHPHTDAFGERQINFCGPDGEDLALVEAPIDDRSAWLAGGVAADRAIHGFHSVTLRLADAGAMSELLLFMGYDPVERHGNIVRYALANSNGASIVDIEMVSDAAEAEQGAGSVHHIAFAVDDRDAQDEVRAALADAGFKVTPVFDRDYFSAIYFRAPGGILFEIATSEPGFDRDEDPAELGRNLMLPIQHRHLRAVLEASLQPIED